MESWSVAQAKAKFSELLTIAEPHGPQTITRNGKSAAVLVSIAEWTQKTTRTGNLAEFFASSPLSGSELILSRVHDGQRTLE
jgi:prevent-host-death family protein